MRNAGRIAFIAIVVMFAASMVLTAVGNHVVAVKTGCVVKSAYTPFGYYFQKATVDCQGQIFTEVAAWNSVEGGLKSGCSLRVGDTVTVHFYTWFPPAILKDDQC